MKFWWIPRVLTRVQAGLFSAVTSAFIIEVHSHLQQDPNDETAALLRVLLYKMDNTTFGNDIPTPPKWTGPPHAIVEVQTILFASLALTLFSAFLAMLGKQWLNQYASTDLRGTAIERSQNRQRKLDGIVAWYFDRVMALLPLMLQAALLLLGCALSRYLWEINITVASVIICVTSSGVAFYIFLVVAGAVSETCPYQTPASHTLRYLGQRFFFSAAPRSDSQAAALDVRCILWMLRTCLDKDIHFSTLKHLTTMVALANVDPVLVSECFKVFTGCAQAGAADHEVVVVQGLEQLAAASALGLFKTISHLLDLDPPSRALDNLRRHYTKAFPAFTDFRGYQFCHIMSAVHCVSHNLVDLTLSGRKKTQRMKTPRWILRFALHSLSLDPPPPTSVTADCLSVIAIDLGCDVSNTRTMASDKRYARTLQMNITLTLK